MYSIWFREWEVGMSVACVHWFREWEVGVSIAHALECLPYTLLLFVYKLRKSLNLALYLL